jgi:hypothetical protein
MRSPGGENNFCNSAEAKYRVDVSPLAMSLEVGQRLCSENHQTGVCVTSKAISEKSIVGTVSKDRTGISSLRSFPQRHSIEGG